MINQICKGSIWSGRRQVNNGWYFKEQDKMAWFNSEFIRWREDENRYDSELDEFNEERQAMLQVTVPLYQFSPIFKFSAWVPATKLKHNESYLTNSWMQESSCILKPYYTRNSSFISQSSAMIVLTSTF